MNLAIRTAQKHGFQDILQASPLPDALHVACSNRWGAFGLRGNMEKKYLGTRENPIVPAFVVRVGTGSFNSSEYSGAYRPVAYYGRGTRKEAIYLLFQCLVCSRFVVRSKHMHKRTKTCNCSRVAKVRDKDPGTYRVWQDMNRRCRDASRNDAHNYHGRGIVVCHEWKVFANFYKDMGSRPHPESQIDRIDNDGNYEPGNCRWVTRAENMMNTRRARMAMYKGKMTPLYEIAKKEGVPKSRINYRWGTGRRDKTLWQRDKLKSGPKNGNK